MKTCGIVGGGLPVGARRTLVHRRHSGGDGRSKDDERDEDFGEHGKVFRGRECCRCWCFLGFEGCTGCRAFQSSPPFYTLRLDRSISVRQGLADGHV